ncbi:hypothetical protein C7M61_005266 [Candidozyma pseudohaemuli]|uniref:Uncharacterized protein n=1 Tax=Candidozyma pseudohaemuli TaxID=418784 RepID=A0A2P7YCG7_9ASCO|nr:hypothetical protein C7M61_005266 [[Candida] pseudohaemulonii]PSK33656.1 hypothetical protein C7M61_005266 [[Candida] pseudohaemulonii]
MQFSTVATVAALAASASAAYSNATTITTDVTVTGYTTYCPESTVVTITKCEEDKCAPSEITVSSATTLTVTEPCVVPTTYTTEWSTTTETIPCEECEHKPSTVAGESTPAPTTTAAVSSYEGAAAKNVAGAVAGVAAVAAALF